MSCKCSAQKTKLKPNAPPRLTAPWPALSLRLSALLCIWLVLLTGAGLVPLRAEPAPLLTVAVFDFEAHDESVRGLGPQVSTLLTAELSAEPQIITVERAELQKVLGEQELGLSGTVQPESAAKVGHLTGAKVLVTGRVFRADKEIVLVAKIIGTETGRVYGELVKGVASTPVTELAPGLARKIAATVTNKADTLSVKVETREEVISRLKKALEGKTLPSVSIRINERHFGRPVIDPAAQTELSLMLQECGFKLVDEKSAEKPQVEIQGEAFSAAGPSKGNLVSCKARVELNAHGRDGKVLAIDRQTSVAVDLTEQTAAKTALENAAAEIAQRVFLKLPQ